MSAPLPRWVALATVLGPLEITFDGVPLAVDGTKDADDLGKLWLAGVSQSMRTMLGS